MFLVCHSSIPQALWTAWSLVIRINNLIAPVHITKTAISWRIIGTAVLVSSTISGCSEAVSLSESTDAATESDISRLGIDSNSWLGWIALGRRAFGSEALKTSGASKMLLPDMHPPRIMDKSLVDLLEILELAKSSHFRGTVIVAAPNSAAQVVADVFHLDGEDLVVLIGNEGQPTVMRRDDFLAHDWANVVYRPAFRKDGNEWTAVIDDSGIAIDKPWHSFGLVKPFAYKSTTFRITNHGHSSLRIVSTRTSCGCAEVSSTERKIIAPGETWDLQVRLSTGRQTINRQHIWLSLARESDGREVRLQFDLIAYQTPSVEVVPAALDLGTVHQGNTVARTLRLSEATTDRFRVQHVSSSPKLQFSHSVTVRNRPDGLRDYLLSFTFGPFSHEPRSFEQMLTIETTSSQRPIIEIPVRFEVATETEPIPSIVNFGVVDSSGSSLPAEVVHIRHSRSQQIEVEIVAVPNGFEVERLTEDSTRLRVGLSPGGSAYRQGILSVKVHLPSGRTEVLRIVCSAYCHDRNVP